MNEEQTHYCKRLDEEISVNIEGGELKCINCEFYMVHDNYQDYACRNGVTKGKIGGIRCLVKDEVESELEKEAKKD